MSDKNERWKDVANGFADLERAKLLTDGEFADMYGPAVDRARVYLDVHGMLQERVIQWVKAVLEEPASPEQDAILAAIGQRPRGPAAPPEVPAAGANMLPPRTRTASGTQAAVSPTERLLRRIAKATERQADCAERALEMHEKGMAAMAQNARELLGQATKDKG